MKGKMNLWLIVWIGPCIDVDNIFLISSSDVLLPPLFSFLCAQNSMKRQWIVQSLKIYCFGSQLWKWDDVLCNILRSDSKTCQKDVVQSLCFPCFKKTRSSLLDIFFPSSLLTKSYCKGLSLGIDLSTRVFFLHTYLFIIIPCTDLPCVIIVLLIWHKNAILVEYSFHLHRLWLFFIQGIWRNLTQKIKQFPFQTHFWIQI